MKKFAALAVLTAGAIALPSLAMAQEGGAFRVRAGLAAVNYVAPDGSSNTPDIESSYAALALGGSFVSGGGWFVDLGLRRSLGAEWNAQEAWGASKDDEFSRTETTLSVGKALGGGFAVFGGVQLAKNEFTAPDAFGFTGVKQEMTSDSTVYFVGGSKAFPVGSGALSVSAALGLMKQDFEIATSGFGSSNTQTMKSDSGFGYSLGAAYNLPLSQKLSLLADLRFQSYSVEYPNVGSNDEQVTSVGVSVVAQF